MAAIPQQLTFDVGGNPPNVASVKLSGSIAVYRQLMKGDDIGVRIIDADGQIIAEADGFVAAIQFKDSRDKDGNVQDTERIHTIKLDG